MTKHLQFYRRRSYLILFCLLAACSTKNNNNSSTQQNDTATATATAPLPKDTFIVDGKCIVFFQPSDKEYEAILTREGEGSGIEEVASDFDSYSKVAADSFKNKVKVYFTTDTLIKVISENDESTIFNRQGGEHMVGVILSDSKQKPVVEYGVLTDLDYYQLFNNYFKK
jgi:hypothetical protein